MGCLIKAEFGFIGCLKEHGTGRRWTKCRDEFGFVIEDLRRYSGKGSFECPLDESFFEKYGKQILGAAGLMMTLPVVGWAAGGMLASAGGLLAFWRALGSLTSRKL